MNCLEFAGLFKDDSGQPLKLFKAQEKIFSAIVNREPSRIPVICPTQYGKSEACAIATITRSCSKREKWCIVGATEKKAEIIMSYVLRHTFDNALWYSQLVSNTPLERLKQERSKSRLTWRNGGEVFILSAQTKQTNAKSVIDSLSGFGSPNIILDDSPLIPNDIYSMVKRMLGGKRDNFLLETGNPFRRNHFFKLWKSTKADKRIFWDCYDSIKEGRYSQEYIDEMREEMFFKVLYECQFPDEDDIDEAGWGILVATEIISRAMESAPVSRTGKKKLGVDIGRGGNYSSYVIRDDNYAWLKDKDRIRDTMKVVDKVEDIMKDEGIESHNVFLGVSGIGWGVFDRLKQKKILTNAVLEGGSATEDNKYANKRAEMNWRMREWIMRGGRLEKKEEFFEIANNRYRANNAGKTQMMSKEQMQVLGIESPDVSDGLSFTFARNDFASVIKAVDIKSLGQVESASIGASSIDSGFSMRNF